MGGYAPAVGKSVGVQDCVVADAVLVEPVSATKSLQTGKRTRNRICWPPFRRAFC